MRAREFVVEDSGATTSGGIATVSMPIGEIAKRVSSPINTKYANTPNNAWVKRNLKNAR
jgi:hypothetical protein